MTTTERVESWRREDKAMQDHLNSYVAMLTRSASVWANGEHNDERRAVEYPGKTDRGVFRNVGKV